MAELNLRNAAQLLLDRYDELRGARESAPELEMLRAALAAPSSPVGDDGLPPLPEAFCKVGAGKDGMWAAQGADGGDPVFTADQVRQAQREAVEAERANCPMMKAWSMYIIELEQKLAAHEAQQPSQVDSVDMDELREILKGIDELESESQDGWWETSVGAEFGRKKLEEVIAWAARRTARKENG